MIPGTRSSDGISTFVTGDTREEKDMDRSEERFRALVEESPDVIELLDAQANIGYVGPAATRILGYSPEELVGHNGFGFVHPDDLQRVKAAFAELVANPAKNLLIEYRNRHKDGSWRFLEANGANRLSDPGVGAIIGHFRVISERKVREEALRRAEEKYQLLEEQYRQSQKMEAIGKLAAGVAHDFNNLLTVIVGYSEMCLGALRPEDPLHVPLTEIHKAGERSSVLTRQLLAFSRKQLLMPVVLDLNTILEEMEKMLRRLIGEDIALTLLLGTNLWRVKADPGQIEQVVMNIVVNAREAMPLGGKLLLETKNTVLDESYVLTHPQAPPGENVLLAITDTGCGMDPSIKARIFEPFFTTKGPTKGTGLGLATVYGIVKQSGGHIEVYSEVDHGTTFKIYLPRDKDGAPVAAGVLAPQQIRGGRETILLVEDEEGVRTLAKTVLQKKGYTILEAQNGGEALLLCETYSKTIDLLVTDVVMPSMSGRVLGERLATLQPKMKILYMSGYTDDAIVQHGVLESGIPFVQKPFAPEALARKVREVLDK
jgi:two-component system cell cycle sensor histidine kinase/response regulator CckA